MPLYEYLCERCSKQFEEIVSKDSAATPDCPSCAKADAVRRVLSQLRLGKKENLRPPFIKGVRPPRR
jgi:putative FmdB family regulatory protein